MKTKQIQRSEWAAFFDSFNREHEGWLTNLEVFGPEIGDQVEEKELAFEGISAEQDETGEYLLAIMLGSKADDHITHTIARVNEVDLEQTDEGIDAVLAIKSEDGNTTILRLRSAVQTESADAVAT